ncbi:uncharacterized protein EDB91DRAFT_1340942 [Suillus paluster]|uniref:uncharacterized protein n=1 Tax=Suillus paluster TaxID=48578 RepID=UPI001B86098F|nr:uncharacterized protein EDB91DRAFT_1340942 [Suillus paluster]KAG1719376.1 hypothetical protein EDB91DRAFT_1340942 [Suillus paluster]
MSSNNTYNLRSRTRVRASSVSTPAHEKNIEVRDDFGNFIVNILSSAQITAEGPSSRAALPDSVESPLTSTGQSERTGSESPSALRPMHSYNDVVCASSPVSDPRVKQENTLALDTITGVELDTNADTPVERSIDHVTFETASDKSEHTGSEDNDDHPWTTVQHNKGSRAKTPDILTGAQKSTVQAAERQERLSQRDSTTAPSEMSPSGGGPSKGKGIDPGNWGAITNEGEIDIEEQCTALESYRVAKDLASQSESPQEEEDDPTETDRPEIQNTSTEDIFAQARHEQKLINTAVERAEKCIQKKYDEKLKELTFKLREKKEETSTPRT